MDGIILINKEKNMTSRDVVNMICKKLNTRRVGHTGTLDPNASGLLVIGIGEGLKLVELLKNHDKDYIAKVKLGIKTNTYDITGEIIEENYFYNLDEEKLLKTLSSFEGEYLQEVPIYSSIKINGKKLYEYAREGKMVSLPKRLVKISHIRLLELQKDSFTFKVTVSSGTYIRSLINDISKKLNILMTLEELKRIRVGDYLLDDATDINNLNIIPIIKALKIKQIEVDEKLLKKVSNGVKIANVYQEKMVMFTKNNKPIAIYEDMGNNLMKSYRVFKKM